MDHQEWFEKFKSHLHHKEDQFYGHLWIAERWRITQFVFIKMAINQLPSVERRVFRAIFLDNLSEKSAAKMLKMPVKKIYRLKIKALKALANSIYVKVALSPWNIKMLNEETEVA